MGTYISNPATPNQNASSVIILPGMTIDVAGTWALTSGWVGVTYPFANIVHYNTAHNINDKCRAIVNLQPGTYTLKVVYTKGPTCGIIDISLNGSVILNDLDMYAAGASYDSVSTTTGITVATQTNVNLDIEVVSKNGASSDYSAPIQGIWLFRTA